MPPEQVKIAITLTDGSLVVMSFITTEYGTGGKVNWKKEASEENVNAEIKKAGFAAASWRFITDGDIPPDRSYRNAWQDTGRKIAHDMSKVREIHLARLRFARAPLLEALDREWMKATGQKDAKKAEEIEARRQKLRDVPQNAEKLLAKAKTIEAVKKISIESLA